MLVGATPQELEVAPDEFVLKNLVNGFTIVFKSGSNDFAGPTTDPTAGTISEIVVVDAAGEVVYSVTDIEGSLPSFWNTFKTLGSAAAFTALLNIKKDDIVHGSEQDDHIGVYGIEGIFLGDAGNDTFIVNEGVLGATLYGTVTLSTNEPAQTDVVEIRGNASDIQFHEIDLLRFGDNPGAKTLTFNGFAQLDVKVVQGSIAGADTLKFVGGSEWANIDISHLQFTNWGAPTSRYW